jgi:hypothetical protein
MAHAREAKLEMDLGSSRVIPHFVDVRRRGPSRRHDRVPDLYLVIEDTDDLALAYLL